MFSVAPGALYHGHPNQGAEDTEEHPGVKEPAGDTKEPAGEAREAGPEQLQCPFWLDLWCWLKLLSVLGRARGTLRQVRGADTGAARLEAKDPQSQWRLCRQRASDCVVGKGLARAG